jgi:integrase/recombinase XerD
MRTHHPDNERIKRQYFVFLKEAKGQSEDSVDAVAKAIARFEADTQHRDFKAFHSERAVAFKRRLADRDSKTTGEKLSKATQYATLAHLKRFFQWLAQQPGYRAKLRYSEAEYFSYSDKDSRVAKARRERPVPTLEQIKHVIASMPARTEIEQRNRALLAFALLTGARDSAIASLRLKHVDLVAASVFQDARDVKTKFSKTFTTFFFPVGAEIRQIVDDWVQHLRRDLLWGHDDPLFPRGWSWATSCTSRRWVSSARRGRRRRPSGPSSRQPSRRRGCRTSTRTACEAPWCDSEKPSASRPRNSRPGVRTWATRAC